MADFVIFRQYQVRVARYKEARETRANVRKPLEKATNPWLISLLGEPPIK